MGEEYHKDTPESQQLLAEYCAGKQQALDSLLVRHLGQLRAFVRLQVGPALRARLTESDLVQSVCVEVLRRAEKFEFQGEAAFRGWLYRAVMNVIRDNERFHRAQRREAGREVPVANPEELLAHYSAMTSPSNQAVAKEQVAMLEAAFTRLPERYAEVLALAHVAGQSRREIATALGISVDAVAQLHKRATLRLARELGHR